MHLILLQLLLLSLQASVRAKGSSHTAHAGHWGYVEQNDWTGVCKTGKMQSPIDLSLDDTHITSFGSIKFQNYHLKGRVNISANGHTELVDGFASWRRRPFITGGGLGAKYILTQFHFHWDGEDKFGSEHAIDGHTYPLEAHFVHIRDGLTIENAGSVKNGMAVIAVFFDVARNGEPTLNITDILEGATKNHSSHYFSPDLMIPKEHKSFFRYNGSLTTPPCSENVIWSILAKPNYITEKDLNILRQEIKIDDSLLIHNWRKRQPLNDRKVYLSVSQSSVPLLTMHTSNNYSVFSLLTLLICLVIFA